MTRKQAVQVRRGKVRSSFQAETMGEQRGACRDIAAQGLASAAVGEWHDIWLCVDISQQTALPLPSSSARTQHCCREYLNKKRPTGGLQ